MVSANEPPWGLTVPISSAVEVHQPTDGGLWLGEEPRPAREPGVAGAPVGKALAASRPHDLADGIQIHALLPLKRKWGRLSSAIGSRPPSLPGGGYSSGSA